MKTDIKITLTRALEILDGRGWVQGISPRGVCAVQAISEAAWETGIFPALRFGAARRALLSVIGGNTTIPKWNDKEGRTFEEVRQAFLTAIENS